MARILVVDEDPVVSGRYEAVLAAGGHEVVREGSADGAFARWWAGRFDLVLVRLSDGQGERIVNVIRQTTPDAPVPVVLVEPEEETPTGATVPSTVRISAPVDPLEVRAAVERLLAGRA